MLLRIKTGLLLAKQSLSVLNADKELLLFPLISCFSLLLLNISFLTPFITTDILNTMSKSDSVSPLVFVFAFLFYFFNYFVMLFFNTCLIKCAVIRFEGGDPTFRDGINAAARCLPQIFSWSIICTTVGLTLQIIESFSKKLGDIIPEILGIAWNIATYFVLPILVIEKIGPISAINRSVDLLKKNWGEALSANIGLGLVTFGLIILSLLPLQIGITIGGSFAKLTGLSISSISIILILLISSVTKAIIVAALYEHAENRTPKGFNKELIEQAFN